MKLKRLSVENIRSYSKLDISFDSGVTVVSGVNGSGKSSLLESCFTGLFGSKTLSKDFVLSDMIRKGAKKASILLEFEQNGRNYSIEQAYRNDPESGRASNARSVLTVDGQVLVDQAGQTYDAIRSLLNMDEQAYRNCVYIRQGEIDVLINAKPKDKQRMIDDLLQIGRLEEYRERAGSARVGVGRHQRDVDTKIKDLKERIETAEAGEPVKTLEELRTQSIQIGSALEEITKKRDSARSIIEEIKGKVSEYSQLSSRRDSLRSDISKFNNKKTEAFDQIGSLRSNISTKKQSILKLQEKNSDLVKKLGVTDDIESVVEQMEAGERRATEGCNSFQNRMNLLEKDRSQKKEAVADIDGQLSALEKTIQDMRSQIELKGNEIKSHNDSISELEGKTKLAESKVEELGFTLDKLDNVDDLMDLLADRQRNLHGSERELSTLVSELEKRIAKSRDLLSKGKCPTCGQELEGSHIHQDAKSDEEEKASLILELENIRKDQKDIRTKLEKVKNLKQLGKEIVECDNQAGLVKNKIEGLEKLMGEHTSRIGSEEMKIKDLKQRKDEIRRSAGEIDKKASFLKAGLESAQKELEDARKRLSIAKEVRNNILAMEGSKKDVSLLEEKILGTQEMIELLEGQINERRERLSELEEKLGGIDISELQSKLKGYGSAHDNIGLEIDKLTLQKENVIKEIGRLENEIKALRELEKDLNVLNNKLEFLNAVYEDAESLEAMYMRIRAELRSRNIDALDNLLNEIFSFMYSNNAYSHIKLDPEYNLTVYEKDGTPLEPKLLSGGERALFNLVLRCAIYRLLSLGVGGSSKASALPPLILDEPTVFLDRGHIQQLIKLIDMMRNIGVGQIIIVSHDESLIDSADHLFQVEKDPVTNTSAIYGM